MKKILIIAVIFVMAMMTNAYAVDFVGVSSNGVGTSGTPPA